MKTKIFVLLHCIIFGVLSAQNLQPLQFKSGAPAKATSSMINTKLSPSTSFLIMDIENKRRQMKQKSVSATLLISNDTALINKFGLRKISNVLCVGAFLMVTNEYQSSDLIPYGFIEGTKAGNIITGHIPIDRINDVSNAPTVKYIQIGEKANLLMDKARTATFLDDVHLGNGLAQPFKGKGVVVGIIDGGFDYTHPNFYDLTGNYYRVKRVWEQKATTGIPPTGYAYGREMKIQSEILAAKYDKNNQSHGTHVTGIAAGSGVGTPYMGGAPESDIVLVSYSNIDPNIIDGINYIYNFAQSVGKPCVINMSLGMHFGPHDGTSAFDQACDAIIGEGKILVGAAGNEGNSKIYISKNFTQTDTVMCSGISFAGNPKGLGVVDLWGEVGKDFKVGVNILNTNTNTWEDFSQSISTKSNIHLFDTIYDKNSTSPKACILEFESEVNPLNNKPHISVMINNTSQSDSYRWAVIYVIAYNTQTKMWANGHNGSYNFTNLINNSYWIDGTTNSTVGEIGGTGKNIISVGAYTSKNNWIDFNNQTHDASYNTLLGEIAPFSSKGPTSDGRMKPDITAPGNVIVSSVNSFDTDNYSSSVKNTVSGVTDGTKNWYYGVEQGTSMASPMVAGIIATWLQANPKLSPTIIKSILQKTAIKDAFVGDVNTWGIGKINALSGLKEAVLLAKNNNNSYPAVMITQVYGGGGNSGATYKSDFIEFLNTTDSDINISGWCLYYIAATSSSTSQKFEFPANTIIKAGKFFALKGGEGAGTQPAWNVIFDGTCTLNLSGSTGKILLLTSNATFTLSTPPTIDEIINNINFMDYVPFGTTAIPIWGSAMASNTTSTTSAKRKYMNGAFQYTKNIGNDFEVVTAEPRNSTITSNLNPIDNSEITLFAFDKTLFISGINQNENIEIFNTTGLKVYNSTILNSSISLNKLTNGIYIVKIGVKTFKIKL
ncbi:MAG: S8 family serine peptidase [Paludibacter sp.]